MSTCFAGRSESQTSSAESKRQTCADLLGINSFCFEILQPHLAANRKSFGYDICLAKMGCIRKQKWDFVYNGEAGGSDHLADLQVDSKQNEHLFECWLELPSPVVKICKCPTRRF